MTKPVDPVAAVRAITRIVKDTEVNGEPGKVIIAARVYDTDPADLFDALSNPERIRRWFLPVSGDLKLGGRYQFEGNAGGTITECTPPRRIAATWEFGGGISWVVLTLKPEGDKTLLELEHTAPLHPMWGQFGPGAVGVGWDLGFYGLAIHVADPTSTNSPEANATFHTTPEGREAIRVSSDAWGAADIAGGAPREAALAAAENSRQFYTGELPPPAM
ncbi:MAG: SRPBCC family protein [Bauldia sp.]